MDQINRMIMCQCCSEFFDTEKSFRFHMRNIHRTTYPIIRTERCKKLCNETLWKKLLPYEDARSLVSEGKFQVKLSPLLIRWKRGQKYVFSWFRTNFIRHLYFYDWFTTIIISGFLKAYWKILILRILAYVGDKTEKVIIFINLRNTSIKMYEFEHFNFKSQDAM